MVYECFPKSSIVFPVNKLCSENANISNCHRGFRRGNLLRSKLPGDAVSTGLVVS